MLKQATSKQIMLPQRKIIHIDMDCFFAAVEIRDNPIYQHLPIAIAGRSKRRGVLSTCNYIARQYGVHSAMPVFRAKQLCPDLVLVPGRMPVYKAVSDQIRAIFSRYTAIIEPLSLDEAYLDVTNCQHCFGSATYIAMDIRQAIEKELNLTASAGVSYCKFLAKIASDENKPNGLCVIEPDAALAFIKSLALKKIPGVGKVAQQKLADHGLYNCGDILNYPKQRLIEQFGKLGKTLLAYSQGLDNRAVQPNRERKSVAVERTFEIDLISQEQCLQQLEAFYSKLQERVKKHLVNKRIIKLGVKVKYNDFHIRTSERQFHQLDINIFQQLLLQLLKSKETKPIRLLGLSVSFSEAFIDSAPEQLSLIDS